MSLFDAQITFCYTRNLERCARFYEEVMELPLVLDQGKCRIYGTAGDAYLGFCANDDAPRPGGVLLTLVTSDVDGWHRRLALRGVEFTKPPAHNPEFGIYHCFCLDPDGYVIEIQRFDDPGWAG